MILALAGGVGGARLASGLASCREPDQLALVVNTGDDFRLYGLHIAPDLDSVMYALAGCNDAERGWGLRGESWQCMRALEQLGAGAWFQLGDKDLATHLLRTQSLNGGASLTKATHGLCQAYGVRHGILPMSDQPAPTWVDTDMGRLPFQEYFVREQCRPRVAGVQYSGGPPSAAFVQSLQNPALDAIVICPSNPYLSIGPIIALDGVRSALKQRAVPAVAVSPIVGGASIKGPLAKIMGELEVPVSPVSVARYYAGLIDGLVIDQKDRRYRPEIEDLGIKTCVTDTVMLDAEARGMLARQVLDFAGTLN